MTGRERREPGPRSGRTGAATPGLTRRGFVAGGLGLLAVGGLLPGGPQPLDAADPQRWRKDLAALLAHPEAARAVGRALRAQGALGLSRPLERLAVLAGGGLPTRSDALAELLARRLPEDFARGRVVSVGGWRLAETEALLCVALA